jgi:hypothetical protein
MTRLFCARCDAQVPEGTGVCPWNAAGGRGTGRNGKPCGSRAFYRTGAKPVRHVMGAALPDEPPVTAEAPYPARRTNHGHRPA